MRYEVHVGEEGRDHNEPHLVVERYEECDAVFSVATRGQTILFATDDREVAEHVRDVWNATARRADDRVAWIREL